MEYSPPYIYAGLYEEELADDARMAEQDSLTRKRTADHQLLAQLNNSLNSFNLAGQSANANSLAQAINAQQQAFRPKPPSFWHSIVGIRF